MECVSSTLRLVICVRSALHSGKSVRHGAEEFLAQARQVDALALELKRLLLSVQSGKHSYKNQISVTPFQKVLLEMIEHGLLGHSIGKFLADVQVEIENALTLEAQKHVARVPFLAMLPMLFLQLPALLMLILIPLMIDFLSGLK